MRKGKKTSLNQEEMMQSCVDGEIKLGKNKVIELIENSIERFEKSRGTGSYESCLFCQTYKVEDKETIEDEECGACPYRMFVKFPRFLGGNFISSPFVVKPNARSSYPAKLFLYTLLLYRHRNEAKNNGR